MSRVDPNSAKHRDAAADSGSAIDDARIGQVFAGRYEIVRRLGTGGMAVVYAGLDRMLQREVALKILKPQVMDDPNAVERLRREARAAGQLHHRHIITFHDVGTSDGTVFIVMELLRGLTLSAERRRCQRLAAARVARIGAQIASALRVVHGAGIIHRDLKPDNVFLIEHAVDDFCKLLDFSIAKLPATLIDGRITQTGTVHGTPHYMPPEQAIGDPVSPASDVYSLGAVLFELLVGRAPFHANNVVELLTVQSTEDAPRVRTLEPDCPRALDDLIARMLARQPHERPATAEMVDQELRTIADLCQSKGGEPPPLPRKRMPAADRTAKSNAYEPEDTGGDRPTGPMSVPEVLAPEAVQGGARAAAADDVTPDSHKVRRPQSVRSRTVSRRSVSRQSVSGHNVPQRGASTNLESQDTASRGAGASSPPPPRQPAERAGTRAVARASGRTMQPRKPTVPEKGAPQVAAAVAAHDVAPQFALDVAPQFALDVAPQAPDAPPLSLPSALAPEGRAPERNHRSTLPSWSGQTAPGVEPVGDE